MQEEKSSFVVDSDWLQERLGDSDLRVVDAAWYLPAHKRDPQAEYAAGHIPGAVFLDHDAISDATSGLPHTLASPDVFAASVGALGISEKNIIVVYDGPGFFSAPRAWWMFRVMGARDVYVLDGGLDGWKSEGRTVTTDVTAVSPAVFVPTFNETAVTSFHEMSSIVEKGSRQIADARSLGRFTGEEAEPRAGMRSGHMPGARSLPAGGFAADGRFKSLPELRKLVADAGIDLDKPVVTSCGSGITAAIITLALQSLGHTDNTLYDGSWSEWGSRAETAIATGKP
ncbi:3-mercaptopyruvate sulfurtransferase [Rhizobium sp. Leaf384]|uniref:3-mercaptopyruvate sulfurtransferase n=1 Tax=unclassified Rhizobium TaxID=2613769 RepID=UPI00071361B8|nr:MULTISPECIES: 3-mercaptopyruvate sulfurtransferase [unclassified Rhizobium]KQS74373.1 3-mercaptopyruvate sulfurtransferase [Rhizobium sp. Leaf383]KQS80112.1 3-mercaptopyruvate sulfurtransferase [Rhizobium sp. Leaf384]